MSGNLTMAEAYSLLHACQYCDSYTGDDNTGCAGRSTPCKYWSLDRFTMPRWAAEYADLIDTYEPASHWDA